jgi:NTP pyrophosphatase (non-canonical NTP hydrolase)
MINQLAKEVHQNARDKGFFEKEKNIGEMLAIIHSEVSEALEADRKDRYVNRNEAGDINLLCDVPDSAFFKSFFEADYKNTFEDELADIVIRVMDLAAFKGIDLEAHIKAKMRYNSMREKYHGKKY